MAAPVSPPRASTARRLLWAGAVVLLAWVAVLAVAGVVVLRWSHTGLLPELMRRASRLTGAPLSAGAALVDWGTTTRLTVDDLRMGSPNDPQRGAAVVGHAELDVDATEAWASRGTRLHVRRLVLEDLDAQLVRQPSGVWNAQELAERVMDALTRQLGPQGPEAVAWSVDELWVRRGRLTVWDRVSDHRTTAEGLLLHATGLEPGKPAAFQLDAQVEHRGTRAEVHAQLTIPRLPDRPDLTHPPALNGRLVLAGLPVSLASAWLPPEWLAPREGLLDLDATLEAAEDGASLSLEGTLRARAVRLGTAAELGQAFDVTAACLVTGTPRDRRWSVQRMDLLLPGMTARARFGVDPAVPGLLRDADISVEVADLMRAQEALPPRWMAERDVKVSGPARIRVEGDARGGRVRVDADDAQLRLGTMVDKKRGQAARVRADVSVQGELLQLSGVEAALGPLVLSGGGHVALGPGRTTVLGFDTGAVAVARLSEVLVGLRAGRANAVRGVFRAQLSFRDDGDQPTLDAGITLAGLDSAWGRDNRVRGDARVELSVRPSRGEALWVLGVDLDGLEVSHVEPSGDVVADKRAGEPAHIRAHGSRVTGHLRVPELRVEVGNVVARAHGDVWRQADGYRWDVTLEPFSATPAQLTRLLPGLRGLPRAARLEAGGLLRGDTAHPADARVEFPSLRVESPHLRATAAVTLTGLDPVELSARVQVLHAQGDVLRWLEAPVWTHALDHVEGKAELKATVGDATSVRVRLEGVRLRSEQGAVAVEALLENAVDPRIRVDVQVDRVNAGRLTAVVGQPGASTGMTPAAEDPDTALRLLLRRTSGVVTVHVKRVDGLQDDVTEVRVNAQLARCMARLRVAEAQVGRGRLDLRGSRVHLCGPGLRAHVRANVEDVDVAPWMAVDGWRPVDGRLNAVVDADVDTALLVDAAHTAEGTVQFHLPQLTLRNMDLLRSLRVGETDLARMTDQVNPRRPVDPVVLYDVTGTGTLQRGVLTLDAPIAQRTNFGRMELSGWMTLERTLQMHGYAVLSAEAVRTLSGGLYRPTGPVRTPIRLLGRVGDIQVLDVDARAFVRDRDIPSMMEAARGAARDTSERLEAWAAGDAEKLRAQVEAEARRVEEEVSRRLGLFRRTQEARRTEPPDAPEDTAEPPARDNPDSGPAPLAQP